MQANFKHVSAKVYDGYFFKSELNIIPDVIVEFPDEVWTFDYVTGTKTDQYQRYLLKKQETYASQGFKSFFLFDESQLVIKEGNRAIALSKGEKGSLRFHPSDKHWEDVLIELSNHFGFEAIVPNQRLQLADHKVHWILCVTDEFNGQKFKISQLEISQFQRSQIPDQWYMIIGRSQSVSFTDLFRYNRDTHQFSWESSQIDAEELNEIVATAEHRHQQIEDDRQAMQEEHERKRRQYEEQRRKNPENGWTFSDIAFGGRVRPSSDFQEPEQYKPTIFDKNTEERVKDCLRVLSIMESTDFPQTNPAFVDRIIECRDDLDLFHRTGELPKRIAGNIQMMKYALQID
ncbi:hypothetical protein [Paenibacillus sp. R14(2021)]|uniref:hypothetical protein n=1 Tax=Paenibacillus sp. R14(2021) TaxID=2859228 RepID=UPI001C614D27|nr:hypothetical protein [Paenibacillus sp. R14(2021)]